MKFESFTVKAREAIADAQRMAGRLGNPDIRPGHLLASLLTQDGGVVPSVIRGAGADPGRVEQETARLVDTYSKVRGGQQASVSRELAAAIESAEREAKNHGDSHTSSEMLLVGIASGTSKAGRVLKDLQLTRDTLLQAIEVVRGGQKVSGEDPESQYEALGKYTAT